MSGHAADYKEAFAEALMDFAQSGYDVIAQRERAEAMANTKRFIQRLIEHYRFIHHRDGDQQLRRSLSASRAVSTLDQRRTKAQREDWLSALDQVERVLLKPRSPAKAWGGPLPSQP